MWWWSACVCIMTLSYACDRYDRRRDIWCVACTHTHALQTGDRNKQTIIVENKLARTDLRRNRPPKTRRAICVCNVHWVESAAAAACGGLGGGNDGGRRVRRVQVRACLRTDRGCQARSTRLPRENTIDGALSGGAEQMRALASRLVS